MQKQVAQSKRKAIEWAWLLFTATVAGVLLFLALSANPNVGAGAMTVNLRPFIRQTKVVACIVQFCPDFKHMLWLFIINLVGNVAIFVPIGFGLAATFRRFNTTRFFPVAIIATGFLLSLSIELAQLNIPSRITDIDDVILNTLGTIIGLAWWYVQALFAARREKG